MVERPILFNAEMVRAILDGRKTQTRRVVKPQPEEQLVFAESNGFSAWVSPSLNLDEGAMRCSPYGIPGDRLWVREAYKIIADDQDNRVQVRYAATPDRVYKGYLSERDHLLWKKRKSPYRGSPGRFMYRSLARITLEVTDVRVERVRDISKRDAIAEGIRWNEAFPEGYVRPDFYHGFGCAGHAFRSLWDSINVERGCSFESNPWVWVLEFEVMQ